MTLGNGPIGTITAAHLKDCEAWLKPLVERDGFMASPSISATDITDLLNAARINYVRVDSKPEGMYHKLKTLLLLDVGLAKKVIRWGMAPQDEEQVTDHFYVRVTARGRKMLQACCKDLWDEMLYGKKAGVH